MLMGIGIDETTTLDIMGGYVGAPQTTNSLNTPGYVGVSEVDPSVSPVAAAGGWISQNLYLVGGMFLVLMLLPSRR